jgi:mono/diheme cytochrome c family protein
MGQAEPQPLNAPSTCRALYRLALVRRLAPLAIVLVFAAGCSTSKPGQKVVLPLPTNHVKVGKVQVVVIAPVYKHGDSTAGKAVFASAGCSGCHTLAAANATGTVGPNLDNLKPPLSKTVTQVINGGGAMPAFKGQLTPKQIADVSAFVVNATGGNPNG